MQIKECKHCGKQFETYKLNQIYCSKDCRIKEWSKQGYAKIKASREGYTAVKGKMLADWCNENGEEGQKLLAEYSSKNELPPEKIQAGSGKKAYWRCSTCGYEWVDSVVNRTSRGYGCPSCSGKIRETNNLYLWCMENGERGQRILSEYSKENAKTPLEVAIRSHDKVYWECSDCGYSWEAPICNRAAGTDCPSCAGKVIKTNNFRLWCQEHGKYGAKLLKEYSSKNEKQPEEVAPRYGTVIWKCSTCGHEWSTEIRNRVVLESGCPACAKTSTSYGEQILYYILQRELKEHKVLNRAKVEGYEVDVFVSDLKFGIEYSGYTYHADKVEQDKIKREALKDAGYNVITILEKKSTDGDLDCDFCIIRSGILDPDEMLDYLKSYMKENYNLDIDVSLSVDEKEVCKQNSTKDYIDIDEVVFVKLFQKTQNKCGEVLGIAGHAVGNKLKELSEKEYAEKVDNIIGIINISRFGDTAEQIATEFELDLDFVKNIQSYIKKYSII